MMLGVGVELRVGWQRLFLERIENGAAKGAVANGANERAFIDQRAARNIDEPRPRLGVLEHLGIEQVGRVRRQRQRENYEVALRHELRQVVRGEHLGDPRNSFSQIRRRSCAGSPPPDSRT